jgi:hypothetical protein
LSDQENPEKAVYSREQIIGRQYTNFKQDSILIGDKIALGILKEWEDELRDRYRWQAPASLAAGLAITFASADFKSILGFSKDLVQGCFFAALIGLVIWSFVSYKKSRNARTASQILEVFKNEPALSPAPIVNSAETGKR